MQAGRDSIAASQEQGSGTPLRGREAGSLLGRFYYNRAVVLKGDETKPPKLQLQGLIAE